MVSDDIINGNERIIHDCISHMYANKKKPSRTLCNFHVYRIDWIGTMLVSIMEGDDLNVESINILTYVHLVGKFIDLYSLSSA
jgi:hypothetical protein